MSGSLTVAIVTVTVVAMHGLTYTFFQQERLSTLLLPLSFCTTSRSRCNDTTSDTRTTSNRRLHYSYSNPFSYNPDLIYGLIKF